MTPKIYILCGIPGSGKTTWIEENLGTDILVISRDIIRATIGLTTSVDHKFVGTKAQEDFVTILEDEAIKEACLNGKTFAIDDINTGKYRPQLIKKLRDWNSNATIIGVNLMTPVEVCIKRREGQIDENIMRRIHNNVRYIQTDEVDEIINVL